ncbi:type II secretion system secretin GspD [Motiliproteus sp. SC1-56]|uniref:type II secretion system secretin GspD n=1 Tax=Motiliproteus sp. SC1-56 TaxID=2799565 RepID=UPI001A8F1EF9|nr:type II secretion system secretin GspD [Motiliproteus sp. SC1-56]
MHERSWSTEPDAIYDTYGSQASSALPSRPASQSPPEAPRCEICNAYDGSEPSISAAPLKGGVIQKGTDHFVGAAGRAKAEPESGEKVTLNFEKADLHDVAGFILGELLKQNYVIDPRVQGKVTLNTSEPVATDKLLAVLETLLQVNSAVLVNADGLYKVVPAGSAMLSGAATKLGQQPRAEAGYSIQVVPLHYMTAAEMVAVLKPVTPPGVIIEGSNSRNLLIISAPRQNMVQLLEMVRMFDVDWIRGLSVGLYPLKHAAASSVINELEKIFYRTPGRGDGMVNFEPIERLNAVLVLSKQYRYLERAQALIEQLDQGSYAQGRHLRIYPVRNGKAEYFAGLLQQLFPDVEEPGTASVAAGLLPEEAPRLEAGAEPALMNGAAPMSAFDGGALALPAVAAASQIGENRDTVTIIPDQANNNLLVMATGADHRTIEAALEKMEIRPRQVLIEATIAEVSLTDSLAYGLQWFIKHNLGSYDGRSSFGDFSSLGGGFTTVFSKGGDIRLLFDALASSSKLKILSSPQILVIDNQAGNIRVGDSIPIVSRQSQGVQDINAPITQEIEYRDTGVLLQVVPHIHASGLVRLEVSLEISQPGPDTFAGGNVSFIQRTIDSAVVVQSGETIVLGGLILENGTYGNSGVPWLRRVPLVGPLFSRTADEGRRTELMITLTPQVVETQADAEAVTEELRHRLKGLYEINVPYQTATGDDRS